MSKIDGPHLIKHWYLTDDGAISTRYWTKVKLPPFTSIPDMPDLSNCQGRVIEEVSFILFENEQDALMFKLKL